MRELERSDRLQVARLAEIGMSSAALLHEMRQPLAAVKLALQMASKEISSQHLEDALAQVDRLAGLLDRAHSFMQPGSEALTEFELEPVVRRVVRLLEHSVLRKSIELVFTVRGRPFVRAAVPLVEQILFNLINNARDSLIERGGGGRLAVIILQDEESAEVIIGDDGVGIPDDYRSSIFAPYMTTKGKGGTGLGLYVARRLAAERN